MNTNWKVLVSVVTFVLGPLLTLAPLCRAQEAPLSNTRYLVAPEPSGSAAVSGGGSTAAPAPAASVTPQAGSAQFLRVPR
jgi:hypothetical protein